METELFRINQFFQIILQQVKSRSRAIQQLTAVGNPISSYVAVCIHTFALHKAISELARNYRRIKKINPVFRARKFQQNSALTIKLIGILNIILAMISNILEAFLQKRGSSKRSGILPGSFIAEIITIERLDLCSQRAATDSANFVKIYKKHLLKKVIRVFALRIVSLKFFKNEIRVIRF